MAFRSFLAPCSCRYSAARANVTARRRARCRHLRRVSSRLTGVLVVYLSCGCGGGERPNPQAPSTIVVREFEVGPDVTSVSRYPEDIDEFGMVVAERAADQLRRLQRDATALAKDRAAVPGDLSVTGRVTKIDGGSRGARVAATLLLGWGFTSYGIGGSTCAVEGQVTRPDGTVVITFHQELKKRSTGWFWAFYGESSRRQIGACLRRIAINIGYLVATGSYRDGIAPMASSAPVVRLPTTSTPGVQPSPSVPTMPESSDRTADRLRNLDSLRRDGLIDEREYSERRKRILQGL